MCARSKFIIVTLHRVQIASILRIESIPEPGDCRWLTAAEVAELSAGLGLGEDKHEAKKSEVAKV